jgi:hypothetical protein
VASDREPDGGVGGSAGFARRCGDRDGALREDAAGVAFAPWAGEAEENPVGVSGGSGQADVAVELGGEAFETLGAVVVLEEERQAGVSFAPDAVAVGADDLTPLSSTAPFRPPLVEPATGSGASGAEQGAEEPVQADEMSEALAGSEVVDEAATPREIAEVEPGLSRYEGGTERPEDPVERGRVPPRFGSEAVEDVEGVQLRQAHPGSAFATEADLGHLCGSENPMVIEETTERTVPFGETTDYTEQPRIEVPPATTTRQRSKRA